VQLDAGYRWIKKTRAAAKGGYIYSHIDGNSPGKKKTIEASDGCFLWSLKNPIAGPDKLVNHFVNLFLFFLQTGTFSMAN
jgi:hypothetical protein